MSLAGASGFQPILCAAIAADNKTNLFTGLCGKTDLSAGNVTSREQWVNCFDCKKHVQYELWCLGRTDL